MAPALVRALFAARQAAAAAAAGPGGGDRRVVTVAAVNSLFEEALAKFGQSGTVMVMIASFQLEWNRNAYLALKYSNKAASFEHSADEEFRIQMIRVAALAHERLTVPGAAAANTQLEVRMHTSAADTAVLALERAKQRLFASLRATVVDLAGSCAAARDVTAAQSAAIGHYKAALVLLPGSISTMRAYAAVLNGIHDRAGAAALLAEAASVEEARSKQSARVYKRVAWTMATNFDVGLDTNAVVQVSIDAATRDVGSVLAANAEACRMFGYSQQVGGAAARSSCGCRCRNEYSLILNIAGVLALQHQRHCAGADRLISRRLVAPIRRAGNRYWHATVTHVAHSTTNNTPEDLNRHEFAWSAAANAFLL